MSKHSNTPELRFPEFDGEWEEKTLGDIGSVAMNKRIYKNETTNHGEIPFYKIGTFGKKAETFISREKFEEYKEKYPYPNKGDILISASGSIGRTVEYDGEEAYYQDSNIVWLQHNNEVLNVFLKYFYLIVKWNGIEGTTIKRLYNKNILNTKIKLPVKEEQQKIGEFFNKLDRQIELEEEKLELLEQQKRGYMQKIFSQELRFKDENGNDYPDWEETTLKNITNYISSKKSSNQYNKSNNSEGYPVYDAIQEIGKDLQYDMKEPYISILKDGAGVGRLSLRAGKSSVIGTMGYIQANNVDIQFLYYRMKLLNFRKFIIGSTIPHLYYKDYSKEKILIPTSNDEQKKIGHFILNIDKLIANKTLKLDYLKQRKQGLLQRMFI
ncbi:restriction endonuclease subunit S [Staphylococcus haemolyticus]|uniref:restriction endonuclease subunit S n=1 Tax=Staphylococcus haemolyticus TaxID=1283 RepID=UPI000A114E1E|nr:restriction endonuclease subunit S [Staphylococcus haemolyticus]